MSNKTFVIKYSDSSGYDTILEHTNIMNNHTKVMWGWWKKFDEHNQYKELTALKNRVSFSIGVVNIEASDYYKATCVNIHLGKDENELIESTEKKYTPEYYREKKCQAWFELTTFTKLTEVQFKAEFFKVPYGDATLFTVSDRKLNESEIDKVELEKFTATKGNAILHLTDIHFGNDHNFKDSVKKFKESSLFDAVKPLLNKYKSDIGVVVASGDFISRANTGQAFNSFNDAQAFLRQLLKFLDLEPKNLILIPGNHDMPLIENEEDPLKDGNYTSQFRKFRQNIKGNIPLEKELEFWAGFKTPNNWNLIFSYFNSAEYKFKYLSNFGYIDIHKYNEIFKNLNESIGITEQEEFIKKRIINFCVIHHHLKVFMPTQEIARPATKDLPSQSVCVLLNAGKFEVDAIEAGMHFVLHGHQHLPYVGSSGTIKDGKRKNLNILSAGSAGSVLSKGYDKFPYNSFSVYYPQETTLKVIIEKYNLDLGNPYSDPEIVEVPYL